MLYCVKHDSPLYVGGTKGQYMVCAGCRKEAEPELYSFLPRRLALDLMCGRLADLIRADESLVGSIVEACQTHSQPLTQPDPAQAAEIAREIERLTRQITFILDAPGESDEDQAENRQRLSNLRSQRTGKQKQLAQIEEAAQKPRQLPQPDEIMAQIEDLKAVLNEAARSGDPAELAALHDIIAGLTGGKIIVSQQGERAAGKGWLRLTFHVRVLDVVACRCGFPDVQGQGIRVDLDIRKPNWKDEMCEKVKDLYDKDLLGKEIAQELELHRSQVTMLLDHWSAKHGQELLDGRKRRGTLPRKPLATPRYKEIAEEAKALWEDPDNLSVLEIARRLS